MKKARGPMTEVGGTVAPTVLAVTGRTYILALANTEDGLVIEHLPVIAWASHSTRVQGQAQAQELTGWYTGLLPIVPGDSGIPTQFFGFPQHIDWCILHGPLTTDALLATVSDLIRNSLAQVCASAAAEGVHYVVSVAADELEDTTPTGVQAGLGSWRGDDPERVTGYTLIADRVVELIQAAEFWTIDQVPLAPALRDALI